MIIDYPFREESIVNIYDSAYQSNDEKYYLDIFWVHFFKYFQVNKLIGSLGN